MVLVYYWAMFLIAVMFAFIYMYRWTPRYNVWFTVYSVLAPIVNFGYLALAQSSTVDGALNANYITYLGGCFLQLTIFFCALQLCEFRVGKGIVLGTYSLNFILFLFALSADKMQLFYKSVELKRELGVSYLVKIYGPLHTLFYVVVVFYTFLGPIVIIHAFRRNRVVSYRMVALILATETFNTLAFFGGRAANKAVELMPLAYNVTFLISIILVSRISYYAIENTISESIVQDKKVGYFFFDFKRRFICCNKVVKQYFGEIDLLRVDRRINQSEGILGVIEDWIDEVDASLETIVREVDKDDVNYEVTVQKLKDKKNSGGYLFTVTDVTCKVRRQKDLAEHARQMQILKESAEAASRAKGDFLANMSHEIRTPINAVLGMDEMILMECEDSRIREYAEDIKVAGNTLLNLIGDILDFSKIESGKMDIVVTSYNPKKLFHDIAMMLRSRAENKGLEFNLSVSENMPDKLSGDEARIRQIVVNLLTNAIKYTEAGSVILSADYKKIDDDSIELMVAVKDTGTGIREEDQESLFGEFIRVDESHTRNIEGTGLGLAITSKLLRLMGSEIKLDSVYGKGSVFYFDLKQRVIAWRAAADTGRIEGTAPVGISFKAPLAKVLVVDDTPLNLKVFAGLLKKTEIDIVMATSGADALELMQKEKYDVIFMDHLMPDMDGIETFKKSQTLENNLNRDVPVVVLTANAISGAREKYIEEGFTDYLSKPVNLKLLNDTLINYLPKDKICF